jgi:hypothetical protein
MSNIFIEDIVGQNDFAVPASDGALGTATTELDSLLSGVANLAYDRVLAWVETTSGAGAFRTLNCVVEKFEYSGEECPDATETQTMTAAIKSTLEGDADITSIGQQQVHILTAGPYFSWDRDAAGGFLYPAITTDDVVVGGESSPQGKWFQDGDMVLGAAAMSGTEKLRVVGSERLEDYLLTTEFAAVPLTPAAGEGTFWVRDDAPNTPMFTDDAGTDHELAISANVTSLQDVDHLIFVDKTSSVYTADGTMQLPFNTIGAAITAATALTPSSSNRIGIVIYPGIYAEAITTADDYVSFIGYDRRSTIIAPTTANSPLDMRHVNVEFANLTFETPSGNTDYIVDEGSITQGTVTFRDCDFLGTNGSANNYFRSRFKEVLFYNCNFKQDSTNLEIFRCEQSTVTKNRFYKCSFDGVFQVWASGALDNYFHGCRFTSTANSGAYYGTLRFNSGNHTSFFYDCFIENTDINGYPVWINALLTDMADFFGCQFESASSYDISGQNYGTIGVYECTMSQGMYRYARTRNLVKYCNGSAGDQDYYTDIDECMRSLDSTADGCVIKFIGDYTSANQVSGPSLSQRTTIDGQGFTWTDTGPTSGFTIIASTGDIWIKNLNFVDATVTLQGAGARMFVENCDIQGVCYQRGLGATTDTLMVIHDCKVVGVAGGPSVGYPISINSANPTTIVSKSYLKGYTGYGAVNFNSIDNDHLKIEYSKLFHASLGTNNPFAGVASQLDYAAHHTTFNEEPALAAPASYTNVIDSGQRHNTIDPDGDFAVMDRGF